MTLGSGVDIASPTVAIPTCFQGYQPTLLDSDTAMSYDISVTAFNSVEEVKRERSRRGSVSGNFGAVSAKLSGWATELETSKRAGLFAVLEARFIGPRTQISGLEPSPQLTAWISNQDVNRLVARCGTHVATVKHQARLVRAVLNLSELEQSAKSEIALSFSAKAKFGWGGGKASGSYKSSVQKLLNENRLSLAIEGTGQPPSVADIQALLQSNGGDFEKTVSAMAGLLSNAGSGSSTYATYGFTLQPIANYLTMIPQSTNDPAALRSFNGLLDMSESLQLELDWVGRKLGISGLPAPERQSLADRRALIRSQMASVRADLKSCLHRDTEMEGSCQNRREHWLSEIRSSRQTTVGIRYEPGTDNAIGAVVLAIDTPYNGIGTTIVEVDGRDYRLDAFKINRGTNSNVLVRTLPGAGGAQTSMPMTLGLSAALYMGKSDSSMSAALTELLVACRVVIGYGNPQIPSGYGSTLSVGPPPYFTVNTAASVAVSPENICSGDLDVLGSISQIGYVGPPTTVAGLRGRADMGMPTGLSALAMPWPKNRVVLRVELVDEFGLISEYLASDDLASLLDGATPRG